MTEEITQFDNLIAADASGESFQNSLQGLEEYEKYEVTEKKTIIENQSRNLVKSLLKVFFDTDVITAEDHINAIENIETENLVGLIESSRYAQHAVSTLMRKIDAGLHADLAVYGILIELQKSALDIQIKVAQYSRTLAPYLKSLREDMDEMSINTIDVLSKVENDQTNEIDGQDETPLGEKNYRGQLAMNKDLREKMDRINARKEARKIEVNEKMKESENAKIDLYTEFEEVEVIDDENDEKID